MASSSSPERGRMHIKQKLAALFVGCTLALGVALTTQPASAASGDPGYVYSGTPIHTGPSQAYPVYSVTSYSAWLPFACWTDTWAGYWQRWFRINAQNLWIRADFVYYQPSLPPC